MSPPLHEIQRFLRELKRRNVYKVAVAYLAVAFVGIQAAGLLVPSTTLPSWADELLVYVAVFGFPLALVIAWAFEMTPDGIRRTDPVQADPGPAAEDTGHAEAKAESPPGMAGSAGTALKMLVGLGLTATVVAGTWYLTGGGERPAVEDRSVAVLPFETLGEEEASAFTEGIQTGILTRLSSISGLTVKSRTSVMRYRNSPQPISEIARELGVTWVLRGEVQESGDEVQVVARLVNAREDAQVWADDYRRQLSAHNLFAVQEEITKRIAEELQTRLSETEARRVAARPTGDLEAYELFIRGRSLLDRRTEPEVRQAASHFERAIARDSSYALAWAGLADALSLLRFYRYAPEDSVSGLSLEAARRAVRLDPGSGIAHASLGIAYSLEHDAPRAIRELRRATELQPSYPEGQIWLSWVYLMAGDPGAAVVHAEEALDRDPMAPAVHVYAAEAWLARDSAAEALIQARRARELESDYALAHYVEGLSLYHLGRHAEADSAFRHALPLVSLSSAPTRHEVQAALAATQVAMGDTAAARALRDEIDPAEDPASAALVRAALGDRPGAFEALDRIDDWGSPRTEILRYYFPEILGPMRPDPRYRDLIRAANVHWGLNPDGSLPDSVDVSFGSGSDG